MTGKGVFSVSPSVSGVPLLIVKGARQVSLGGGPEDMEYLPGKHLIRPPPEHCLNPKSTLFYTILKPTDFNIPPGWKGVF